MPDAIVLRVVFACRIVAGFIGVMAFYFAFFLYEDEEGIWQNRLEQFWLSIYDRAKHTDYTATALLNRIGEMLKMALDRVMGAHLLSLRAIAASLSLSFGGSCSVFFVYLAFFRKRITTFDMAGLVVLFALICLSIYPLLSRTRKAIFISLLTPLICLTIWLAALFANDKHRFVLVPLIVMLSSLSNYLIVVTVRTLLKFIATASSIGHLGIMVMALIAVALLVGGVPPVVGTVGSPSATRKDMFLFLFTLNISTTIFCTVPALMLMVVLLHKVIWPTLSRLTYPLIRHKVVTNRKVLVCGRRFMFDRCLQTGARGNNRHPQTVRISNLRTCGVLQ